jgi:hypothetical protein
MSEFGTNDASHELIPLYMYALTLPTKQTIKNALPGFAGLRRASPGFAGLRRASPGKAGLRKILSYTHLFRYKQDSGVKN